MNRYIEIMLFRCYAELKVEASRGYFGMLWWVLEPVIYLSIFYFYFAVVRNQKDERMIAFLLVGLVVWKWFAATIPYGGQSIIAGRGLMRQVYLPKVIFPCVAALTTFVKFLFVLVLLLLFLPLAGVYPTSTWLFVPILVAVQFFLQLGIVGLLASVMPFVPDLAQVVNNLLMVLFFLSGVFFNLNNVPEHYRVYLYLNPVAVLINSYRLVFIDGVAPEWPGLAATFGFACLLLAVAEVLMRRFDKVYSKVLL